MNVLSSSQLRAAVAETLDIEEHRIGDIVITSKKGKAPVIEVQLFSGSVVDRVYGGVSSMVKFELQKTDPLAERALAE